MNARFQYYLMKAREQLRQKGAGVAFQEIFSFLIRRKFFLQFLSEFLEYHLIAPFRNDEATILQVLKNEFLNTNRVLLYASFDAGSEIKAHVIQQLGAFSAEGYQIVFTSTSPTLPSAEYEKIKNVVSVCIHRKNEGYDFVSWKVAERFIASTRPSLESLILMNDSCFGPAYDLSLSLKIMLEAREAVYGITKSEEMGEHIQSYFYHFGSGVINSPVTREFFDRIRVLKTKWGIVRYLEIGSSKGFRAQSVPLLALVDPKNPQVSEKMKAVGLSEPTREPLASEWVRMKMSPFYKRSNLNAQAHYDNARRHLHRKTH